MRRFVLGWKALGHERRLGAHVVNYADDFVICCRGSAAEALAAMRGMMSRLKLAVNEAKTHVCQLPVGEAEPSFETFDFLGYTFGRYYSPRTGRAHLGAAPSRKRVARVCGAVSEMIGRDRTMLDAGAVVGQLNRALLGWANYFCLGPVSKAYRAVDQHAVRRLRQWLCIKHKVPQPGTGRFPDAVLYQVLGLVRLPTRTASFPWARA
jgi:hypothetical protein